MNIKYVASDSLSPGRDRHISSREFRNVRNIVVRSCGRHGTVGPVGQEPRAAEKVVDDPDFHVVDDFYGDDRWVVVEPKAKATSAEWLSEISASLAQAPGWEVLVNPGQGVRMVVGPTSVRVAGWNGEPLDLKGFLEELRSQLETAATDRSSKEEERLREVRRLVVELWPNERAGVHLVGFFSSHGDGRDGDSVWLLHLDDRYGLDLDKYSVEPDAMRRSVYWVGRSGAIAEYSTPKPADAPDAALLVEWILVERNVPISGVARVRLHKHGQSWTFDLPVH